MPSPFPGMDPYIEDPEIWGDFHSDLAAEIRTELNRQLQPRYVARIIPRVTYELVEVAERRNIRPDVGLWQPAKNPEATAVAKAIAKPTTSVESSIAMEMPLRLSSVEIYEVNTLRLVAAIEILSPVNKRPSHDAYEEYQRKRREILRSQAHLLEIDLLRGGSRPPLEQSVPSAPYYVVLSRVERRPRVEVWPIQLWDALPVLPIPLTEPDEDASLDLGAMVKNVYERGAYSVLINYAKATPSPAFERADMAWIEKQLQEKRVNQ